MSTGGRSWGLRGLEMVRHFNLTVQLCLKIYFPAMLGRTVSTASIVCLLRTAYLDTNIWDKMDKLYAKFIQKNPSLPTLAVLLSIL